MCYNASVYVYAFQLIQIYACVHRASIVYLCAVYYHIRILERRFITLLYKKKKISIQLKLAVVHFGNCHKSHDYCF